MKHLWKSAVGPLAVIIGLLNQVALPASVHPYVYALTAIAAAFGIYHLPYTPAPTAVSNQSGAVSKEFVVLVVIGMCVLAATWHYLNIHAG